MASKETTANSPGSLYLKLSSALLALFLFIHPLLYWDDLRDASSLPRYALLGVVACALLVLWGLALYRRQISYRWHPVMILLAAVLFWAMLSLNWTMDPLYGFLEGIQLLGLILLCFVMSQFVRWEHIPRYFLLSVMSAVIVAIFGLQQNFGFNPFGFIQFAPPAANFTNKNFVTLYLDLIVFIAWCSFFWQIKNAING